MRITYREGQRLRADDLTEEQEYLIAQERRHNLEQHASGVVSGLGRGTDPEVNPGLAVDAEGRLLVAGDAAPVQGKCIDAWLIHCDTPGRPRRRGSPSCEAAQTDRRQEIAQVVTVPATAGEPIAAPTEDAVYLGRIGCPGKDLVTYTSAHAASVKDPGGRALMQVGPSSATDRNAFLISTAGSGGPLAPRIALDRFGNNQFTGNVTLADYHYCQLVRLTNDKVLTLIAKDPGSLGAKLHLLITPSLDGTTRQLTVQIYSGTEKLGDPLVWKESQNFDLLKDLKAFELTPIHLDAVTSVRLPRFFDRVISSQVPHEQVLLAAAAEETFQPKELFDRFPVQQDVQLHPCGGSLLINDWPASNGAPQAAYRGCNDFPEADSEPPRDPPGLSFHSMAAVPKAPPIPGIYSIRAGDKKNPIEELHLDLGKKRDSDLSVRFALGARRAPVDAPFVPWLEVNGICGVSLPFPNNPNAALPPMSVHVSRTIERGPIKPDMSDPTFTNLMATAWLAGLQKGVLESTTFDVSFALPATIVDSNHTFAYDVKVNHPTDPLATAEGFIETLKFANGNPATFSQPIKPPKTLPINTATPVATVNHFPQTLPPGKVRIRVVVYGKSSGAWWWKSHEEDFTITAAPSIDKSGIPDSVPPNTPFEARVGIRNDDDTSSFVVHKVTIDVEENAKHDRNCPPHHTEIYTRQYLNGIPAARDIAIDATTEWDDTMSNPLSDSAHVDVKDDLTASIANVVAPTTTAALQFDLNIDAGNRPLKLLTVKQRLTSIDFQPTPFTPIAIAQPDLNANDHLSIAGITGAQLPAASNNVKLEIDIEYKRDGRTWHSPKPFVNEEVV